MGSSVDNETLLLLHGAVEIVTITSDPSVEYLSGDDMSKPQVLHPKQGSTGLSLLTAGRVEDYLPASKMILAVLEDGEMEEWLAGLPQPLPSIERVDVSGCTLLPGFIDAHTHPVWAGDRMHEWEMKLAGATYMDIHAAGGGIHFTVRKTQEATPEELLDSFLERAEAMIESGTTTLEAKSGYGLDLVGELKMLRVLQEGADRLADRLTISATFCGAHAIPVNKEPAEATDDVLHQIEAIAKEKSRGRLDVLENVDVFCERGVYTVEQARFILRAGMKAGLRGNFHGEELSCLGSAEMGAEEGVTAISHLEEVSDKGIEAMGKGKTAAVLLPSTAYILHLRSPPARKLIHAGVPVALGSDFNPNAYCLSMPLVMSLACVSFGMMPTETLVAATLNSAYSIGRGHSHGALQAGRSADVVVLRTGKWQSLLYQLGSHSQLIRFVIKAGRIVFRKP